MSDKIMNNQTNKEKNQTTGNNKEMPINYRKTVAGLVPFQKKPSMLVTNLNKQHSQLKHN